MGKQTKKVTITLTPKTHENAREQSIKLFGRENVSGFIAYVIENWTMYNER